MTTAAHLPHQPIAVAESQLVNCRLKVTELGATGPKYYRWRSYRYLEAGEAGTDVGYLGLLSELELRQDGDDGFDDESTDLAPHGVDVVAESLQSSKHAAYRPLRPVVLRIQHVSK